MPDLDQPAAALQLETRAVLRNIVRNGSREQSALAEQVLQGRLLEDLRLAVRRFEEGSQRFTDLANSLQTVIDAVRVNPFGDALSALNGLLDRANRIGQAIRDPETLPPLSDDGLSITFTLPARSDEAETPPAAAVVATPEEAEAPEMAEVAGEALLPPSKSRKFAELQVEYAHLYEHAAIRPQAATAVAAKATKLAGFRDRYREVGDSLGIPWHFIACIHAMESDCNFTTHLHNGDPLGARTVRVPAGRPQAGAPPFTWEGSARDALTLKKYDRLTDWSLPRLLYRWEGYNGFGYRPRQVPTPYLWSRTSIYTKGKYIADGRFDAEAVSQQIGCAALLKALVTAGVATI